MTYRELWRMLEPLYGKGEACAITDFVLDAYFGLSKADVLCGAVDEMVPAKTAELLQIFARLLQGEPVQYVIGRAEFSGRWFNVCPSVLIPRPETEELCALVTTDWQGDTGQRILDVGTGSGCIAVTLALDMPENTVEAWDISPEALAIAEANARRLGANVAFSRVDALGETPDTEGWNIIVSNPPYICDKEKKDICGNVLDHEPHGALFVPDDNPLLFYRAICRLAARKLLPDGAVYFELNPLYADQTADMARQMGFNNITIYDDMYGKRRMMKATFKGEKAKK